MGAHPDLAREQAYLDAAYDALQGMRDRTRATADRAIAATEVDTEILRHQLRRRLALLEDTGAPLCFGRIDHDAGDRFYVGRRHVEDGAGDPVVVDWRARAAIPFYRATVRDAMGLHLRRRFSLAGRELLDILDEVLDDPDADWSGIHGGVPDPLLAELERARTGEMRDIVATIQAEQDRVIRAPIEGTVIVQGGPGTGKTAVGLHRAAFLLYEHRERLEEQGVLVLGPNTVFLRYISQVLPSLGETAVRQTTVAALFGERYRVRADDTPEAARLKGDARMADVLRRACVERIRPPKEDLAVTVGLDRLRVRAADLGRAIDELLARGAPLNAAREAFRRRVDALVLDAHRARREAPRDPDEVGAEARADREFRRAVDRIWPSLSPPAVVRSLLGSTATLRRAAADVLTPGEQAVILRRTAKRVADEPWTPADVPLLDEVAAIVDGPPPSYGHVVVDEAQDLSAMALRMVGRRGRSGSMTVLGDLAQATAPAAQTDWGRAAAQLAVDRVELEELTIGYRLPAALLDFANRLLPSAAPHVRPSRSVRTGGRPPDLRPAEAHRLGEAVGAATAELSGEWASVGVIVPASWLGQAADALRAAGVAFGEGLRVGLDEPVTLIPPATAKGLEFDAVVVAEPAGIVAEEPHGERALYVALTRAVQQVTVVHSAPLPAVLSQEW